MTVNARSAYGNITGQLFIGNDEVIARNQKLYIKTDQGKDILYADKDKILFASDKLEFSSKYLFFIYAIKASYYEGTSSQLYWQLLQLWKESLKKN